MKKVILFLGVFICFLLIFAILDKTSQVSHINVAAKQLANKSRPTRTPTPSSSPTPTVTEDIPLDASEPISTDPINPPADNTSATDETMASPSQSSVTDPVDDSTPILIPTSTPTPTSTPASTPTFTPTPSLLPTPTSTPTSTPTPTIELIPPIPASGSGIPKKL